MCISCRLDNLRRKAEAYELCFGLLQRTCGSHLESGIAPMQQVSLAASLQAAPSCGFCAYTYTALESTCWQGAAACPNYTHKTIQQLQQPVAQCPSAPPLAVVTLCMSMCCVQKMWRRSLDVSRDFLYLHNQQRKQLESWSSRYKGLRQEHQVRIHCHELLPARNTEHGAP